MGTLWDLAQQYRENQLQIEIRLLEIREELKHTTSREKSRRLRHRINVLEKMLVDSRADVHEMERYYDKR